MARSPLASVLHRLGVLALLAAGPLLQAQALDHPPEYYDDLFGYAAFPGFLQRYLQANPGLQLDPTNQTQLAELADRLDIVLVEAEPELPWSSLPPGSESVLNATYAHDYGIIGGTPAQEGRNQYMVSLRLPPAFGDNAGEHFCAGTLIRPDVVLTAAHCFYNKSTSQVIPQLLDPMATVGLFYRGNLTDGAQVVKAVRTEIHPDFKMSIDFSNDVALLQLERPVPLPTIKLNEATLGDSLGSGTNLTILGWGVLTEQEVPQQLRVGTVPYVPLSLCAQTPPFKKAGLPITATMLCAGQQPVPVNQVWPAIPPVDACRGDSGGPLLVLGGDKDSDVQYGIVSFGIGCAEPGVPGVYTNVQAINPFLQQTLASFQSGAAPAGPAAAAAQGSPAQGRPAGPTGVASRSAG